MPSPTPSENQLVLIPSYNTGPKLRETVEGALEYWAPVWVILDGSDDGSEKDLEALQEKYDESHFRYFTLETNQGKGSAVLHGIREADKLGMTDVLTMDSDGQHPPDHIPKLMEAARDNPGTMVLGLPIFDESAPTIRLRGRKLSNWWANLQTLWGGIGDSLFGFRLYPIQRLIKVMESTRWARRFDFDAEVAIRLVWKDVEVINIPVPCKYLTEEEGGVSHFNYLRDNILLTWMYLRLLVGFLFRLPILLWRKVRS